MGIAVSDLEAALSLYVETLGCTLRRRDRTDNLEFALLDSGGTELELLRADDPESAIGKFVADRGPGLHHLAYCVSDLESERARLVGEGFAQSGEVRVGVHGTAIVFFHPKTFGGVLTELVQVHD